MNLPRILIAFLIGVQCSEAKFSISEGDVIDVILERREAQLSDDVNRDFKVDVADLISLYRENDELRLLDSGVDGLVWLNRGDRDLNQLLGEAPDAVNELAVVIGALLGIQTSPSDREELLVLADELATRNEFLSLWGDDWNGQFQTVFSQLHAGGDLDGDGNPEEDVLALQVDAFRGINPFAFGCLLSGHSVETPFLPVGLRANPYTLALRRQLLNELDPSVSWFLSWLVAVADIDEAHPVFAEARQQVFARVLEWELGESSELSLSSEWAIRKILGSGDEDLVRLTLGEPFERMVTEPGAEGLVISHSRVDPRTLLVNAVRRTEWESQQLGFMASALGLSPSTSSKLLLGQVDRFLDDQGVRQYSQLIRFPSEDLEVDQPTKLLSGQIEPYFQSGVDLGLLPGAYPVSAYRELLVKMSNLNEVPELDELTRFDDQALAVAVIVDSFKVITASDRTAFYGQDGLQQLQQAAAPLAQFLGKVLGTRLRIGENLPVVDVLFQRAVEVGINGPAWDDWLAQFHSLREDLDIVAGLTGSESEPMVKLPQPALYPLLSPSRLGDASLILGPSVCRLLKLSSALFLYEQGAYLHRQLGFAPFENVLNGVPPRLPAIDALEKYLLAWRLLVDAMPSSELGWAAPETLNLHGLLPMVERYLWQFMVSISGGWVTNHSLLFPSMKSRQLLPVPSAYWKHRRHERSTKRSRRLMPVFKRRFWGAELRAKFRLWKPSVLK